MFINSIPQKIEEINTLINKQEENINDYENLKQLHRNVHSIAGTSATFALKEIAKVSRGFEKLLKQYIQNQNISQNAIFEFNNYFLLLKATLDKYKNEYINDDVIIFGLKEEEQQKEPLRKIIYFYLSQIEISDNNKNLFSNFGYDCIEIKSLEDISKYYDKKNQFYLLIELNSNNEQELLNQIKNYISNNNYKIFLMALSDKNDFESRLKAVRYGFNAYFLKPLNAFSIIKKLDKYSSIHKKDPYKILIIDDDVFLSEYFSVILETAGMITKIVNNPATVLDILADFNPDLILLDKYMPNCNGDELALIIRQIDAFFSIPIVFISTEKDILKQIEALKTGGDDFLTKPIDPSHLVSSVSIRAERMNLMRNMAERDSLTGLYNHSKLKEKLDICLEQAEKNNSNLSYIMIDIDKFKSINDNYGHFIGDKVILSLTSLLQQKLRKIDIIGRYGGEEFAVILPDIDENKAFTIIDFIRKCFSEIKLQFNDKELTSTFSAGIASYPKIKLASQLNICADKALYSAKRSGRNKVIIYNEELSI